ncbi:MAG TPA: aldo/keto reductase [Acidobacteriaceae bacterium]|jgi:aryl-alcohol dehydrogenase-like predicted oxidoreductase
MTRWKVEAPLFPPTGRQLTLGLGLIGIGKPWGHTNTAVPPDVAVLELLRTAYDLGIRYFDTAPSYGCSEDRLGKFLGGLTAAERGSVIVATRFGEHWNAERSEPFVDHTHDALARSLDRSLERLGRIDFLQLHKTTPEALRSRDVERAFAYAASLGIRNVGASVSDLESARIALSTSAFSVLQFPFNSASVQFRKTAQQATEAGVLVVANRPFGMGGLLYGEAPITVASAFDFLCAESFQGVVLTGTKSGAHLRENWKAFQAAISVSV